MLIDFIALERKVSKKQLECVRKNHVCRITNQYDCNVCFNAFQTVMGQNYSSNRIYTWTMMQFYCKDPEFVQIICFEIALQESY